MIRLSHPYGNPNSYNAAVAMAKAGLLRAFHTCLYGEYGLGSRFHPEIPPHMVRRHPGWEIVRQTARRGMPAIWRPVSQRAADFVAGRFDRKVAKCVESTDRAVYCYEDSALATFERARELGASCIYELPIMHYREMAAIFQRVVEAEPSLAPMLRTLREPEHKLQRKDAELLAADVIVVPAEYVRDSITCHLSPKARIVVVPYGCDVKERARDWHPQDISGPLKLLLVGALCPRKGLQDVFAALSRLPRSSYELTLAGRWEPGFEQWLRRRYAVSYRFVGQVAHSQVFDLYRRNHVFVLPSLAEGSALVVLEAMVCGVPVIVSDRTVPSEFLGAGKCGFGVGAGQPLALLDRLEWFLANRAAVPEMGKAARRSAENFSWAAYRGRLLDRLTVTLGESRQDKSRRING